MIAIALVLAFLLPGCARDDPKIAHAKEIISARMRDPNSTQFKNVARYTGESGESVCGWVNAKNAYGGYVGFERFVVWDKVGSINIAFVDNDDGLTHKQFASIWRDSCRREVTN